MALINVTGTIQDFNGGLPASGVIRFELSRDMTNSSGVFISRATAYATVDPDDGTFAINLESTTDANPDDRTYRATFIGNIQTKYETRVLGNFVLTSAPATQNLSEIIFMSNIDINSGAVVFNQAGTGAVPRTLQSKLRDWVSVADFGADSSGVVDSTTAIQNAINSLTVGAVYVPRGVYILSSALTYTGRRIQLYGDGPDGTILWWPAGGSDGMNPTTGTQIIGMTLRGSNTVSVGNSGIDSGGVDYVTLENLVLEKWGDHGCNTGAVSNYWVFRTVIARNNINDGFLLGSGTTYCRMYDCLGISNGANGFDCNGSNNQHYGCYAVTNGPGGGVVDKFGFLVTGIGANADNNKYFGCFAISNGAHGFVAKANPGFTTNDTLFSGCSSIGNTGGNGSGYCVDGSSAGALMRTLLVDCLADTNQAYGVTVDGSVGTVTDTKLVNTKLTNNTGGTMVDSATRTQVIGPIDDTSGIYKIYAPLSVFGAGIFTGTLSASNFASGAYTPTVTASLNLSAVGAKACQWVRVGNSVLVSGAFTADPTSAATTTALFISLPVTSTFAAGEQAGGVAFASAAAGSGASVIGALDSGVGKLQVTWVSNDVTNQTMYFIAMYQIV